MKDDVDNVWNEDAPRFLTYSTHDWTVATMLEFLNATNGNYTVIPFASSIHYELHSNSGCQSEECYWVEIYSDMKALEFVDACTIPSKCSYPEFLDMLRVRDFIYTNTHYND